MNGQISDILAYGLSTGVLYSLFATGFALVYNSTKILHVASAAIYVLAAVVFWWASSIFHLPIILCGVISIVVTMAASLLTDLAVYRPLTRRNASGSILLVASIGLMTVIFNLLSFSGLSYQALSGEIPTTYYIWQIVIGGIISAAFLIFLSTSGTGMKLRALSSSLTLFETLGNDSGKSRTWIFAWSGFFIASASCLYFYGLGGIDFNAGVSVLGMSALVNAMVAMILGGVGRYGTCLVGGLILGLVQQVLISLLPSDKLNWLTVATFIILILFLLLRPQGIAGNKRRVL